MNEPKDIVSIKGFIESSFLDWPGKVTSVIFLPFCNFRCPYCQNHSLLLDPNSLKTFPLAHVLGRLRELKDWVDGICITGGEPTLHATLPDLISKFRNEQLSVKLDTNGSNPSMLEALLKEGLIDCVAMDMKAPLDELSYSRLIGVAADLKKIKKSIHLIKEAAVERIFRITVVPELLAEEEVYRVAKELCPCEKLIVQRYNPENPLNPELKKIMPWPQEKIDKMQQKVDEILRGN